MPWPREHKEKTRERIVRAAAAAFRERGIAGVRVEEVRADAGLTHGGFYAHFESKDELIAEALTRASNETLERLSKLLESVPDEQRIHAVIDGYLSTRHAAHPEHGCPLAALGAEVARAGGKRRRRLAQGLHERLDWMRGLLPRRPRSRKQADIAVGVVACMVGGMILARTVGDSDSAAVLEATREFLHAAIQRHHE
jgi:TetR/AcrR family transcriptional regulator, transcriptional repressor for nem operon